MKTKQDHYQVVTDRILTELIKGSVPWVRPWVPGNANIPVNAIGGNEYRGCNVFLLWLEQQIKNYPTARWLTFKQAHEAGGHVKKGETHTKVYLWKPTKYKTTNKETGENEEHDGLYVTYFQVFNVAQCEGLPEKVVKGADFEAKPINPDERNPLIDAWVKETGIPVLEKGDRACYIPSVNQVWLPEFAKFKGAHHFYATLFHELVHATGHKDCLDRNLRNRFGKNEYAAEELVAELGAAFLTAEFGINGDIQDVSYIAHWIKILKEDKTAFITAASKAQQAVDFLRGKTQPAYFEKEAA